jgi:hypothetical protein
MFPTEKIYVRLAENMMKERGNDQKLKRAQAYLDKELDLLREIHKIEDLNEEDESKSLYLAMHYQFRGKLTARKLDNQLSVEITRRPKGCISGKTRASPH